MKNLFFILLTMCVYGISAQIQQAGIVPLEEYYTYKTQDNLKLSDVTYFKDINNLLDPYVGVWAGSYDNKTLNLEISKQENILNAFISYDKLLIKYKITDSNGQDLVNTLNMFDSYRYHMTGKFFNSDASIYLVSYEGLEHECNQKGTVLLELLDSNTMTLWVIGDRDLVLGDCPDGNIHILPTEEANAVVLNKQN
ncbi:MAG: hypothetical protein KGY51_01940 [Psychroflexus sp.]|nr:hypothetical protein [Psychroflexus sp.]